MSITALVWLLVAMCVAAALLLVLLAHRYEKQMIEKPPRESHRRGPDREE